MPDTKAGILTDNLLRRLRDPEATGLSRPFVRRILSDSQRFVNGGFRRTKETETLTTNAHQQFYKIQDLLPNVLRIEKVRENGRDLRKCSLRELCSISTKWHREVDGRFRHFALIGRDLLVVYPSKPFASSVEVVYTKLTAALDSDDIEVEIPDDDMVQASDLAQIIMLTKMREFSILDPILKQFVERTQVMLHEQG